VVNIQVNLISLKESSNLSNLVPKTNKNMQRRRFISAITSFTSSLFFVPFSLFAKIKQQTSSTADRFTFTGRIFLKSKTLRVEESLSLAVKWSHDYMSLEDFAEAFHFGLYTNDQKRKTVLYLEKDRITFTADNTFVKFNDQMLQMPLECQWYDDSIWVPVKYFTDILNKYTPFQFQYNSDNKQFGIEEADVNITGVRIAEKENGTLIDVFTTKRFKEKEIIVDIRNRWLHIDVYGAKIDPASLMTVQPSGIISEVKAFQMAETASLSFKLKKDVLSRDLVINRSGNDFHVNLRTKEIIAENKEHEKIKSDLEEQKKRWIIDTIVIDAGHGGKDPGAIGYSKVKEKDLVLPMALALGKRIQQKMPDIKVVYTRKRDVFIPLWKRTKIANDVGANLFISIHCNSNRSSRPNGYETYFVSEDKNTKATDVVLKENSAIQFEESQDRKRYEGVNFILATMLQSDNIRRSQFLASEVQASLKFKLNKVGMTSRGVKQGPFWVLVGATMPNILVECGYISNKYEEKLLRKQTTQKKIAEGIFAGIEKYKAEVEKNI
jgi:N-acetylmuramoyl-L-alanine amidase